MATKDIRDAQVCQAVRESRFFNYTPLPVDILKVLTGQPAKVCYSAMERASSRGLIECGTSIQCPWLTPLGEKLLDEAE